MNEKNLLDENEVETEEGVGVALELLAGSGALSAVDRAAIDIQVATAKQYPRSVDKALKEALTLATLDEDTAASMFYALPRGGKTIEGPSARLAEVMTYAWGNLRADADIVAEDRTHVTAMGTCFDVERNVAVRVRVKRRITDRHGRRYNEDMIGVTANAAISIALRNAVFKVVPMAFVRRIYGEARKASLGEAGTMAQKRQKALEWFANAGVKDAQVFEVLGVKGLDDIGEDELITLRGLITALQDGETSVEQVFRRHDVSDGAGELNDALEEKPIVGEPTETKEPGEKSAKAPKKPPKASDKKGSTGDASLDMFLDKMEQAETIADLSAMINEHVDLWNGLEGKDKAEFNAVRARMMDELKAEPSSAQQEM